MLPEDIDGAWDTWQREFLKIMEQTIPKSTLPNRHNIPWVNKSIVQAVRKRNGLSELANNASYTRMYTRAHNRVTTMIRNAKWSYFRSFSVANSGDLWKTIEHLNKRPTLIADLNLRDGNVASTPQRKPVLSMLSLHLALTSLFHH